MASLFRNGLDLAELFAEVALVDPVSAALLAVGNLLLLGTILFGVYLVLGAFADALIPEPSGPR